MSKKINTTKFKNLKIVNIHFYDFEGGKTCLHKTNK